MPKIAHIIKTEFIPFLKSPWIFRFLFCIVLVIFFLLIYRERKLLVSFHWSPNYFLLLLSLLFHSASLVINYLVWHLMVKKNDGTKDPLLNLYSFAMATISRRIPTPIWYLGSRFIIYNNMMSKNLIGLLSLYEIFLLGSSGAIATFISFSFKVHLHGGWLIIVIASIIVLFLMPFLYPNWIGILFRKIVVFLTKQETILPAIKQHDYVLWWLLYFFSWVFEGMAITSTFFAFLPSHPDLYTGFTYALLSTYTGFVSQILPAGLGIKEIVAGILFHQWLPTSVGTIIALIYRLLITLWELICSLGVYRIWQRSCSKILPKSY